ncbi:MAG: sugar transferase, partial [Ignavibacteria bacterium]|nr:sugar transferase [Ignavibacteria bacterium]
MLFSFRSYDDEQLESFCEQFLRFLISSVFSVIITAFIYSILKSRLPYRFTMYSLATLSILIPSFNYVLAKYMIKHAKPKSYLVIGKRSELESILLEITKKSKGKYIFEDFVNPSPTTVKEKIIYYDHILIGDYELYKHAEEIFKNYPNKRAEYLPIIAERVLKRI